MIGSGLQLTALEQMPLMLHSLKGNAFNELVNETTLFAINENRDHGSNNCRHRIKVILCLLRQLQTHHNGQVSSITASTFLSLFRLISGGRP